MGEEGREVVAMALHSCKNKSEFCERKTILLFHRGQEMNVRVCHVALPLGGIARSPYEVFILSSFIEGRDIYTYFRGG